jgi:hypothetical protein
VTAARRRFYAWKHNEPYIAASASQADLQDALEQVHAREEVRSTVAAAPRPPRHG